MKKFALLFAAVCMVAFVADESFAQCGGGGYYGGGGGRSFYGGNQFRGGGGSFYRPSYNSGFNISFGNSRRFNSFGGRPSFSYGSFNRGRSFSGGRGGFRY